MKFVSSGKVFIFAVLKKKLKIKENNGKS